MQHLTTEVVIVGGGPVGLGLAIELGQRGVACTVIEKYRTPAPIPRGQNLTQRTMESFIAWGAEAQLRAARTVPPGFGIGGMTSYRTLFSPHVHDWLQRELVRPYYATDNERLPQYATEAVLRARAAEIPAVTLLFGWQADDFAQDAEGVTVTAHERDGAGRLTLRGASAVGCDGSRSMLREAAGIGQVRTDHDRLMALLVFRSERLDAALKVRCPGKAFFCVLDPALDGYWKFFGRVDDEARFFFHAPVPAGTTRDGMDWAAMLHEAAGETFDVSMEHVGFWDLRVAHAERYRAGRAFVAGDAAHSHPPYGGYGINTGFEDARNLGWKLAADLRGWAGAGLLDSYDAERRPVFVSTARDFIERSIETDRAFLRTHDPACDPAGFAAAWAARTGGAKSDVDAFEPNYDGSPVVWGPPGAVCSARGRHSFTARPGRHLAPLRLSDGRGVHEALGAGFTLLAFDAPGTVLDGFEEAARRLAVPLQVVADDAAAERARYGAHLVLVRPDQFVAWAATEAPADPEAVLARAIGAG